MTTRDPLTEAALATFIEEAADMLRQFEDCLVSLARSPEDEDTLAALFRAAHTIKGSAGLFGMDAVVAFTHVVETLLDQLRSKTLQFDAGLNGILLECKDQIEALVEVGREPDATVPPDIDARGTTLVAALQKYLQGTDAAPAAAASPPTVRDEAEGVWHISLRFGADALRNGLDPAAFLRYLPTVGDVAHVTVLTDAIPAVDDMDPESCYLGFEIRLRSAAGKAEIARVFEFARDDCAIRILPPGVKVAEYLALIDALPEERDRIGEILVGCGAVLQSELDGALVTQRLRAVDATDTHQPLGAMLVEARMVPPEVVARAAAKQQKTREKKAEDARMLRVPADRLDSLINLVGELVIAGAGSNILARSRSDPRMQEATQTVSNLVERIRNEALQLRMVQIGETFARFRRTVLEIGRDLGKDIELVITGGEAELDKSVVERVGDPLMHLVRNAIDHGLESTEARIAAGKPARGTLTLNAYHESGSIVVEVSDDGKGLDRDRILQKARERGLVGQDDEPGDDQIHRLIFEAGFSTADTVSNLSGRGVGMDVVRRNIEALGGAVSIRTVRGEGTTFALRLPLTLAIIDGFLVAVGSAHYVIPLDQVLECIERPDDAIDPARRYLVVRGEVLPVLGLRERFGADHPAPSRQSVVVVRHGTDRVGVVVDRLLGELQTVIKPLGALFRRLQGIGGSTILGSGEVALILDVPGLVAAVATRDDGRAASVPTGRGMATEASR